MKHIRLTRFERGWVRILGVVTFLVAAFFFVSPLLPDLQSPEEPLADPVSLKLLTQGKILPVPPFESAAEFHGHKVTPPTLASLSLPTGVLGLNSSDKRIEVDLTNQKVYAFEGDRKMYDFPVSTGKWAPTPTGEFTIWTKVKSQKMSGGVPGTSTYYYLPNVPWVMFFYNSETPQSRGFSLHGTYWHNNFGHPMSHGCVNMRIEDAGTLFAWASPVVTNDKAWSTNSTSDNPGTRVIIYGTTPQE